MLKGTEKMVGEDEALSDFSKFEKNMQFAKALHDLINDQYHGNTYAYYAADPKQRAWNEIHWRSEARIDGEIKDFLQSEDDLNGSISLLFKDRSKSSSALQDIRGEDTVTVRENSTAATAANVVWVNGVLNPSVEKNNKFRFKIQEAKCPGDGTVPEESGSAPTPHVVQIFRH